MMGLEGNFKFKKAEIIDLRRELCVDESGRDFYEAVEKDVITYLSSNYKERRDLALSSLRNSFSPDLKVHTLESSITVKVYLSVTEESENFLFVGNYIRKRCSFELVPDAQEVKSWEKPRV